MRLIFVIGRSFLFAIFLSTIIAVCVTVVRDHQGLCRGFLLDQNRSNSNTILLGIVNDLHHAMLDAQFCWLNAMIDNPPMVA